jgi:hypothetical protein
VGKNILFSFKKVEKNTILSGQGGQLTPLALPADAPGNYQNNIIRIENCQTGICNFFVDEFY